MSFWSRLFGGGATPTPEDARASVPPSPEEQASARAEANAARPLPAELAALVEMLRDAAPPIDQALASLARLRRTPNEARALDELAKLHVERPLPEPVALAVASAMLDRGEPAAALKMLAGATSSHALLVKADLHAESGDLATAVAVTERVLLRELDHPGARERHRRWRTAMGLEIEPRRNESSTTTMVTSSPETPYVLLREMARGGAGAVYEAEDRDLGRRLALKVYHDADRDRGQLVHEARTAAALAGPGVVRVFDVDPDHGWLAVEWAPLGALREAIRTRALDLLLPIEKWALPLATTLARVHAAGWVHLDVKPANVLLAAPDRPVLVDFGIARRIGDPAVGGSFGYVSPERLGGRASEPRDDVYGFGRLLEDALDALAAAKADANAVARWRPLAQACVARDAERLADGAQIVTRIRTELLAG